MSHGPLHGYRILDLTTVVLGPYATQILGDMGADVVKIEAPRGDIIRQSGQSPDPEFGAVFMALNRNKRSIALDLKNPASKPAMHALLKGADVFVHNVRLQAMARLGYTYAAVQAINPDIIYVHIIGYGSDGPYAGRPGYDDLMQAVTGASSLISRMDGNPEPRYFPTLISDKSTGLHVVYAVFGGLLHRERTGQGQAIEVPMFESTVSFLLPEHLSGRVWQPPQGDMGYRRMLHPYNRPFKTKDGYLGILPYTDREWVTLFRLGGRPELIDDPRTQTMLDRRAHIAELYALVEEITRTRTTAEWSELLAKHNIPFIHVNSLETLMDDEHLTAAGFFEQRLHPPTQATYVSMRHPVKFGASPAGTRHDPPALGAHGREILAEAGLSETDVQTLIEQQALVVPGQTEA